MLEKVPTSAERNVYSQLQNCAFPMAIANPIGVCRNGYLNI